MHGTAIAIPQQAESMPEHTHYKAGEALAYITKITSEIYPYEYILLNNVGEGITIAIQQDRISPIEATMLMKYLLNIKEPDYMEGFNEKINATIENVAGLN
jgi:hypothetical protein